VIRGLTQKMPGRLSRLSAGFARPLQRRGHKVFLGLILFLFPFSLLFVVTGLLPSQFSWIASLMIAFSAAATLVSEMRSRAALSAAAQCALLSGILLCVEYVGVTTGVPFGRYTYTDALGFRISGVPLAIPLAWYTTVVNSWRLSRGILERDDRAPAWMVALLAAALTVALDLVLEPMASSITMYWVWSDGLIPVQNYLSWGVFSMIASFGLSVADRHPGPQLPSITGSSVVVLGSQFSLFAITDVVHGQELPVLAAVLMMGVIAVARICGRHPRCAGGPARP